MTSKDNEAIEGQESLEPKVPTGCKVIGWFWIIGVLIVLFQFWNKPGPEVVKMITTAVGLFIAVSAIAMVAGNKIGLAVFSSLLLVTGIGMLVATYISSKTLPASMLVMSLLFYFLPSFYLFSKWKVFVQIAKIKKG